MDSILLDYDCETVPPVLENIPADVTVDCNSIPTIPDNITASDNCDGVLTEITFSADTSMAICPFTITRTWSATDECNNTATASQVITVQDDEFPVLVNVPIDITVDCDNIPEVANVTATDNCTGGGDASGEGGSGSDDTTITECQAGNGDCLLYTSPSPRDQRGSRMPSSA